MRKLIATIVLLGSACFAAEAAACGPRFYSLHKTYRILEPHAGGLNIKLGGSEGATAEIVLVVELTGSEADVRARASGAVDRPEASRERNSVTLRFRVARGGLGEIVVDVVDRAGAVVRTLRQTIGVHIEAEAKC